MSEKAITQTLPRTRKISTPGRHPLRVVPLPRPLVAVSQVVLLLLVSVALFRGGLALWRHIGNPWSEIWASLPLVTLVCVVGALLLVTVEIMEKRWHAPSEYARKFAHVGAGLISLSLPAFFATHWPVLVIVTLFSGALLVSRRFGWLASLHPGAQRGNSDILFLWAAYLVFLLTDGNRLLFQVSILVLTVGDAAAALVGQRYGRLRYQVSDNIRSFEGSMAFMGSALFSVLLFLLGFNEMSLVPGILLSLPVATIATAVEALSPRGLDNLTVPIAVLFLAEVLLIGGGYPWFS